MRRPPKESKVMTTWHGRKVARTSDIRELAVYQHGLITGRVVTPTLADWERCPHQMTAVVIVQWYCGHSWGMRNWEYVEDLQQLPPE